MTMNATPLPAVSREAHPVADIFPVMSERELSELADDIAAHGLREPIWIDDAGRILDGRNRYQACRLAGVEPGVRVYDGPAESLVPFVVSLNLHRRHLDESQRAMVAGKLANMRQGERTDLASIDARTIVSQTDAAELLNVSRPSVQRARVVLDHGTPDLVAAVEAGAIAVSTAAEIADCEPETQQAIVEDVKAGTPARKAITTRHARRRRRPLPDDMREVVVDLSRVTRRAHKLRTDDRFDARLVENYVGEIIHAFDELFAWMQPAHIALATRNTLSAYGMAVGLRDYAKALSVLADRIDAAVPTIREAERDASREPNVARVQ